VCLGLNTSWQNTCYKFWIILWYILIFYYYNIVLASTYPSRLEKNNSTTKIIRIISGCKYRNHTSNYFTKLHRPILKFLDNNILQTSLFMLKVPNRLLPLHLTKSFYRNSEIHQYCTRSSENYYLKSANTNIKHFSIKCKGPNVWILIPVTIWSLNSIKKFKRQRTDSLLQKY